MHIVCQHLHVLFALMGIDGKEFVDLHVAELENIVELNMSCQLLAYRHLAAM